MNERIRKLSEQARKYARDYIADCKHYGHYMEHNELDVRFEEKFAELIVQECAGLFPNVYVEIENEYGHTPVIAADYIKKHFGVEE